MSDWWTSIQKGATDAAETTKLVSLVSADEMPDHVVQRTRVTDRPFCSKFLVKRAPLLTWPAALACHTRMERHWGETTPRDGPPPVVFSLLAKIPC